MSFKRARAADQAKGSSYIGLDEYEDPVDNEGSNTAEAAKKFRRLLIEKYLDGSATATDTCQLAYWHVESGGEGAEDLALNPRTASRHSAEHLRSGYYQQFVCNPKLISLSPQSESLSSTTEVPALLSLFAPGAT